MMRTENPQPHKTPIIEPVRNIIGALNLANLLICIGSMLSAFIQIMYFENPLKAVALITFAAGMNYLFRIRRIG